MLLTPLEETLTARVRELEEKVARLLALLADLGIEEKAV